MNDHQIIALVMAAKVASGEWARDERPTVRQLSQALREIERLDVAARVESGETVYVLRD